MIMLRYWYNVVPHDAMSSVLVKLPVLESALLSVEHIIILYFLFFIFWIPFVILIYRIK